MQHAYSQIDKMIVEFYRLKKDLPKVYIGFNSGRLSNISKGNQRLTTGDYKNCSFTYNGYGQRISKSYRYESKTVALENLNLRYCQY